MKAQMPEMSNKNRKRALCLLTTVRIICSLCILTQFARFTYNNLQEFNGSPTSTMYSYSTEEGSKYPDIILCNSVQHDKAKLSQSDNWAFLPDLDKDVFDNLAHKIGKPEYTPLNRSYYILGMDDTLDDNKVEYLAERRFDLPLLIEATLGNLTSKDTQPDDFIIECWFRSMNCSDWFEPFPSLAYGTCLNLTQREQNPRFSPIGHLQEGYQVTFYRNPLRASGIVEPVGGVSVAVSDQKNYLMVPEVQSWMIPWGQGMEMKLQKRQYYRVKNCTNARTESQELCIFMCLDFIFLQTCDCAFSPYQDEWRRCSAEEMEICVPQVGKNWGLFTQCQRECKTPCEWEGYTSERSNMNFPSYSFTPYLIMDILDNKARSPAAESIQDYLEWWKNLTEGSNITHQLSTFMMLENIRHNFAYLHIYLGNNKEVMREDFIISFWTIFSNIGGNVGIWLGLSAFNILDIIYINIKECLKGAYEKEKRNHNIKMARRNIVKTISNSTFISKLSTTIDRTRSTTPTVRINENSRSNRESIQNYENIYASVNEDKHESENGLSVLHQNGFHLNDLSQPNEESV